MKCPNCSTQMKELFISLYCPNCELTNNTKMFYGYFGVMNEYVTAWKSGKSYHTTVEIYDSENELYKLALMQNICKDKFSILKVKSDKEIAFHYIGKPHTTKYYVVLNKSVPERTNELIICE